MCMKSFRTVNHYFDTVRPSGQYANFDDVTPCTGNSVSAIGFTEAISERAQTMLDLE
jgi:hypothetical protein